MKKNYFNTTHIDKIEIEFMIDAYINRSARAQKVVNKLASGPKPNINLWVSKDNGTYTLYEGDFDYEYKIEKEGKVLYAA